MPASPTPAAPVRVMQVYYGQQSAHPDHAADGTQAGERTVTDGSDGEGADGGGKSTGSHDNAFARNLQGTEDDASQAVVLKNMQWLVPAGSDFNCTPGAPIDTQIRGSFTCSVDKVVWNADGTMPLINAGATARGEILPMGEGGGVDRAFVLFTYLRTNNCEVKLASPGADSWGQIGAPGILDEHLWRKIKAATLLTGIETISGMAQNAVSSSGNTYLNLNQGNSLAQTALAHDIDIPTTLYRGPAWTLKVHVQRHLWFTKCYKLGLARP